MNIRIQKYCSDCSNEWNAFIKQSVNGTFLLDRNFMDYHQNRFEDASLMIYKDDILVACIPANQVDRQFYSHLGLTYGGVILNDAISQQELDYLFQELVKILKENYDSIEFRWQPEIYNEYHTVLLKALETHDFKNFQALNNLHANLNEELLVSSKKTAGYRNGKFDDLRLVVNQEFKAYWQKVLEPQLQARHNTTPVHSLVEIELLGKRFQKEIKQYLVYKHDELLAGVTFFLKDDIAKSQYAAATINGMKNGALDFLYLEATQDFKDSGYHFLDYGHVNKSDGGINRGLQRFKEELGAVNQPIYKSQWTKN